MVSAMALLAERLGVLRYYQAYAPKEKRAIQLEPSVFGLGFDSAKKDRLVTQARELLRKNTITGRKQIGLEYFEYSYICPALPKYPHQWLWDSSFHSIVTSRHFEEERAIREIESLLKAIHDDGLLPGMVYWSNSPTWFESVTKFMLNYDLSSNLTQPPVIAIALEEAFLKSKDRDIFPTLLAKVEKYFDWLATERDPDQDGLVSIIHPWEGLDASPVFDLPLGMDAPETWRFYAKVYELLGDYAQADWDNRKIFATTRFNVEYLIFNCIYVEGLRAISRMNESLGNSTRSIYFTLRADKVEKAIMDICWDEQDQIFYDVLGGTHEQLRIKSISSLFPIILEHIPKPKLEALVKLHLVNENEFWVPFPIPTVAKNEKSFNPVDGPLLWRGPTWINTNWFLIRGLVRHGFSDLAREIAVRSLMLIDQTGFWEFYNPLTGEPEGQPDYSWSTLALDFFELL